MFYVTFRIFVKQSKVKLTIPIFAFFKKKTVESINVESLLSVQNFSSKRLYLEKARFLMEKKNNINYN